MKKKLIIGVSIVLGVVLAAFAATFDIYSTFSIASGSGPCSVSYNGLANYVPTNGNWGWKLTASGTHTASIGTNAIIEYAGNKFHNGCGIGSVTIGAHSVNEQFRFTVYWPSANGTPPSGSYPVTLNGFLP